MDKKELQRRAGIAEQQNVTIRDANRLSMITMRMIADIQRAFIEDEHMDMLSDLRTLFDLHKAFIEDKPPPHDIEGERPSPPPLSRS